MTVEIHKLVEALKTKWKPTKPKRETHQQEEDRFCRHFPPKREPLLPGIMPQ